MKILTSHNNKQCQICNHCGESVYLGSGKFVNRIPDLNDVDTRISNGLLFPFGDFVCEECDVKGPSWAVLY